MTNVSQAASVLGRRSAQVRVKKWGEEEFRRRLREWGKLGGRPRKPTRGSEVIDNQSAVLQRAGNKQRDNDGLQRRGIWHFKLKVGGRWREISTRTSNYQEARKARQQSIQAQEDGRLPTDMAKWRFEKAAPLWLADRVKLVARQTYRIDKERLVPLTKEFGGRRLCEITSNDIRGYQALRADCVGPRTITWRRKSFG